jgi:diguanylate cyclase (GGDEF)-like protein
MGKQETKYWIDCFCNDTLLPPDERAMTAPPISPYPKLRFRRRTTTHRFARVSAAQLQQERFFSRVSQSVTETRDEGRASYALLVIDLDGFTRVHASVGVDAANRVLAAAEARLRGCLGPDDEIARMGEDEFHVLVACGGNATKAWQVAELMQHVLTVPYQIDGSEVAVTACIGIALVLPQHVSPADATRDARAAVHRAKSVGSARCAVFDEAMHTAPFQQLQLGVELRRAIDLEQFRMYYQPILDCQSGALLGLEALIRWEHPSRGCLPPSEFLDALNQGGLMPEIGRWIVSEVARQSVEWRDELGLSAPIAINVSPRQLSDSTLVASVLASVAAAGASPASIVFEMTEEMELGEGETPLQTLRDLRAAGFRVYIDDFGTGYSSLSYLQRIAVDGLKIDRAFVRHIEHDAKQREVVSAIIRLAHVLGLDVVAEGVERREQFETLRAMGCDRAQGHYLSPPLAPACMRAWLTPAR